MKLISIAPRSVLLFLFLTSFTLFSQEINNDVKEAMKQINENEFRTHILFLSDNMLQGRKTGSFGDNMSSKYIATQFKTAGLTPAMENNTSYFQPFKLTGILTDHNMKMTVIGKNGKLDLDYYKEFIGYSNQRAIEIDIKDAEVVFAGFGIQAPEYEWDDFKDVDVKGKILLVLNNDPEGDPAIFEGTTRTYYGRWIYKYEEAARKGAIGAIIIHTNKSAGYNWQTIQTSWGNEEFILTNDKEPKLNLSAWLTLEASRKLLAFSGFDLDQAIQLADNKAFKPIPLGVKISISMKNSLREIETKNVIGLLKGSDKKLKNEYIIYTAHYDHLGIGPAINGDSIYNGAFDNASGVSSIISMAKAFTGLKVKPKRSILFIATAAEEPGMLGSEYFCQNPIVESPKMAAIMNIDGVNIWGPTKDIVIIGGKYSNLLGIIDGVAKQIDMYAVDDQNPNFGGFFRSDQFPFAKIGIPGISFSNGDVFAGNPNTWGKSQRIKHIENFYHMPSDEVKDWWNYQGMIKNTELFFLCGLKIANDKDTPQWKQGNQFDIIRKKTAGK
jgi:Zn-dependent M28 family amino/carboxypeptidase